MNKIDVYIINLDKNVERKKFIKDRYSDYFNLNFISAIYDKIPNKGCYMSHINCIKYAKNLEMDYIIVMEDDCKNRNDNFYNDIKIVLNYLENNMENWDIFIGGTTNVIKNDIIKKDKYKNMNFYYINKGNTFHFVIYNKKSYDFFLNNEFNGTSIDKIWHNKLSCITTVPFIFVQQPCYSDIELKYKNYNKAFIKAENNLNL